MKIAFIYDAVYPWLKGGGEKSLYELALELRQRGHEPHLFGMQLWDGPADIQRDGLHYHGLCPAQRLYAASGRRHWSQPVRFAYGLLRRLPRYPLASFDVIDVHAFPIASLPPFERVHRRHAPRVPWVLTWLEAWGPAAWREYVGAPGIVGARVERWAARVAPAHLCISPTTAHRLVHILGAEPSRVRVIPRGFRPPDEPLGGLVRDPGKVVIAGRLRSYKRIELAIRAWPAVVAQMPHARLHVIGDGPELAACRRAASELGIAAAVSFHGQLADRRDVLRHLATATLVLQPSRREGQSTVVLEALSLGTPVLAAAGPETAVADFLGDPAQTRPALVDVAADHDAWASRIVELLSNAPLRGQLVAAGQQQAQTLRWREDIAPQIEALYHSIRKL